MSSPSDHSLDAPGNTGIKKVALDDSDYDDDDDQFYTEFATQQPTAPKQQQQKKKEFRRADGGTGGNYNKSDDEEDDSLKAASHQENDDDIDKKLHVKKKRSKRGPGKNSKKLKTMNGGIPRPRGRPKLGHKWDNVRGVWVPDGDDEDFRSAAPSPPKVIRKSSKTSSKIHNAANSSSSGRVPPTPPRTSSPYSRMRYTPQREEVLEPVSPEAKLAREKIVTLARMDLWSDNEEVLANGLQQLTTTCEPSTQDGEFCRRACFETGVHMLVIKLLERFPESAILQTNGLRLLFRMSTSSHEVIDEALIAMGAIEVASEAIFNHADDSDVLMYACALLGNLTRVDGGWDAVMNMAILPQPKSEEEADTTEETQNLLSAIQDLLERHSDYESFQEAAIFFIDVCLEVGKTRMLDLLVEHAPRIMSSFVRASKIHGPNNANIRRTVRSVFKGVAELTGKN